MNGFERMTLANLAGGGAEEIFQRELARVLANIADPNTPAQSKRKIVLTVEFKTREARDGADVSVAYETKLARPYGTSMPLFFRNNQLNGQLEAIQARAKQVPLFGDGDQSTPEVIGRAEE